jgi:quercetin dioxygenase-like cupin family protein
MHIESAGVSRLHALFPVSDWQRELPWKPFQEGVGIHYLYGDGISGPSAALVRFNPGGRIPRHEHTGYEHILILSGSQADENNRAEAGTLIINPPGSSHGVFSEEGCIVMAIYEKPVRFSDSAPRAAAGQKPDAVLLAVNGTLMRGLELNPNMLAAGAEFVQEAVTEPAYRLWTIGDRHPAMIRSKPGGASIAVEVWSVPAVGLASILLNEPAGLCIGKVRLSDGSEVLGVLGEPALCEGQSDITEYGGWRAYTTAKNKLF